MQTPWGIWKNSRGYLDSSCRQGFVNMYISALNSSPQMFDQVYVSLKFLAAMHFLLLQSQTTVLRNIMPVFA